MDATAADPVQRRTWSRVRPWIPIVPLIAGPLVLLVPTLFILPSGGTFVQQRVEVALWGVLWVVGLTLLYRDFRTARVARTRAPTRPARVGGSRLAILSAIILCSSYIVLAMLIAVTAHCVPGQSCTPAQSFVIWFYSLLGGIPTLTLVLLVLPLLGILLMALAVEARISQRIGNPGLAPEMAATLRTRPF